MKAFSSLVLFASFFCVLVSFKAQLHYYFMVLKLVNLLNLHWLKQKISKILFITSLFFFLKFSMVNITKQGFSLLISSDYMIRIAIFVFMYICQIKNPMPFQKIKKLLECHIMRTVITSGLNAFDIGTFNYFSTNFISGPTANFYLYTICCIIFGSSCMVNRFFTVYPPHEWKNARILKEEGMSYLFIYSMIMTSNLLLPSSIIFNYTLTFVLIFCRSCHNWMLAERKRRILLANINKLDHKITKTDVLGMEINFLLDSGSQNYKEGKRAQ